MKGKKNLFKTIWLLIKNTFIAFSDYGLKYSAALAYYTIFSLGPLILIIISVAGIFFGKDAVQGHIYEQINQLVGKQAAIQIQELIKSISLSGKNIIATIIGVVTLLIGTSGIFSEIQDSINSIWGFRSKPKTGILKILLNRLLSFSIIISMGFLLLVSLTLNTLVSILSNVLSAHFPQMTVYILLIFNNVLTFVVITVLFAMIFKILPDAKIKWKEVRTGAIVTALLFMAGKFLIGFYIGQSKVASGFGAAGSIIVTMVWVYYNAIILYLGAEFTQVYVRSKGMRISPNDYADAVEIKTIGIKKG